MHYFYHIILIFVGCCSNVFFLELLTNNFRGSGNVITLAQFLFISIKGFIFESKLGTKKTAIPIHKYFTLVVLFFIVSVLNNAALGFNISMPLHMIFRSGSLIANMCLGMIVLKKRYTMREYVSIVLISLGIGICTYVSSHTDLKHKSETTTVETVTSHTAEQNYIDFFWLVVGLIMLTVALFFSAGMGILQEKLYAQYGKYPDEALYYNHVLTLPAFLFMYKDIANQVTIFNQSEPVLLVVSVVVPTVWLYLIGNTLTQYVCIKSVFVLTTECSSLTVTLVLTLRKFASLLISIIFFDNPFTVYHWIGTIMVFLGTLMFTNFFKICKDTYIARQDKKKKAE